MTTEHDFDLEVYRLRTSMRIIASSAPPPMRRHNETTVLIGSLLSMASETDEWAIILDTHTQHLGFCTLDQKKTTCVSGQRARQFQPCASTFLFFQFNSFATLPVLCLGLLNVQLQLVVHEQCTRLKNTKY